MIAAKLDIGLALAYERYLSSRGGRPVAEQISVFLHYEGDLAPIEEAGFDVAWRGGHRVLGTLRFADLPQIAALPGVVRLVAGMPSTPDLDSATFELRARATSAAAIGTDGLWHVDIPTGTLEPGLATGRGVIIGIIDSGIDVTHPAFASSLLPWTTRISHVWDQGLTPRLALGESGPDTTLILSSATYGVEYDVQAMVSSAFFPDLPPEFRHRDCVGHGTHVASIAAGGNLVARGRTVGVAPEAEIMMVKHLDAPPEILDETGGLVTEEQRLFDAVIYLLRKAKEVGKPIVVNASIGRSWEPGDGLGESEWFLDRTFDPAADPTGDPDTYPPDDHFPTGAVFVKSAGNDGDTDERLTAEVTIPSSGEITVPVELYDFRSPNKTKRIGCVAVHHVPAVDVKAWCRQATPVVHNISVAVKPPGEPGFSASLPEGTADHVFDGGKRCVLSNEVIPMYRPLPTPPGGYTSTWRRRLSMVVEPKAQPPPAAPIHRHGIYELRFVGPAGTVLYLMGTAGGIGLRIADTYADDTTPLPAEIEVTNGRSMVYSGGRHVITVAAHDHAGELAPFSSRGPLRDFTEPPLGALAPKPDISAPGVKIYAARSVDAAALIAKLSPRFHDGDREARFSGTSMSAPMVAGIVALMLQRNPNLNIDQVRAALVASTAGRPGANPAPADPGYADAFGSGRAAALEAHAATPPP